jgi:hypothetical protein
VTFKEHPVAMYGQAIFDALLRGGTLPAGTAEVTVVVPTFAADYGHQDSSDAESIGSVAGITRKALAAADPSLAPTITVVGDERLGPLDARVEACDVVLVGSGDTSGWGPADVAAYALKRAGAGADALVRACQTLAPAGDVSEVWDGWRAASR